MQIQLASHNGRKAQVHVDKEGPVHLIEGRRAYAVKVGDRILGFSAEDVASVSLDVNQGNLQVQLHSAHGQTLGSMSIPGSDVIKNNVRALEQAGIAFSVEELDQIKALLRLSLEGNVPRAEFVLLLDEISHMAVTVNQPGAIQTEDLYPDLARQVRKLLQAMPEEIQRYVIMNNADAFPENLWKAFHLVSKVNNEKDSAVSRFLAGQLPLSEIVAQKILEIGARQSLSAAKPITQLDPKALTQLVKLLDGRQVVGDNGLFDVPQPLARHIFQNHNLKIPDFTAAASFEELERNFLIQHQLKRLGAGPSRSPLGHALLRHLDGFGYRALADFAVGKTGAPFSSEVKAELVHFLKNQSQGPLIKPLSSLDSRALERLENYLQKSQPKLLAELAARPLATEAQPPNTVTVAENLASLEPAKRLAFFLLDRLDPVRNPDLFRYFNGESGLDRMTRSMKESLSRFMTSDRFPTVRQGLTRFDGERYRELVDWLERHGNASRAKTFLPDNPVLRQALMDLDLIHGTTGKPGPQPPQPGNALVRWDGDPDSMAGHIYRELDGVPMEERDGLLTDALAQRLRHFKRVALLDQIWKAERLVDAMLGGRAGIHEAARDLSRTLNHVLDILAGGEELEIDWDIWDQGPEKQKAADPRPSLRRRLLEENKGLSRYFKLDQWLPEQKGDLREKVETLGNLRRVERFLQSVDNHRSDNHPKLLETLKRFKSLLRELSASAQHGAEGGLQHHVKSPFTNKKQRQFQAFREALLEGRNPDASDLFKEPFLRSEMGERAESHQRLEMKRLEPLFKEALARLDKDPGETVNELLRMLRLPGDTTARDAGARIFGLMENIREFNQNQNLNQQPMYLSLPMKLDGEDSEFELAWFKLPGGDREKKRFLVVVHLDFPKWGHLRVDALKDHDQLSATFWVENPKMHHLLLKRLHELEDRLEDEGMGDAMLTVKIEPRRASSNVADLCVPSNDGQLDMKI